jgi:hypothetical protein
MLSLQSSLLACDRVVHILAVLAPFSRLHTLLHEKLVSRKTQADEHLCTLLRPALEERAIHAHDLCHAVCPVYAHVGGCLPSATIQTTTSLLLEANVAVDGVLERRQEV